MAEHGGQLTKAMAPASGPREIPAALRWVRGALRRLNAHLNEKYRDSRCGVAEPSEPSVEFVAAAAALDRILPRSEDSAAYLAEHRERLARTIELTPPASMSGRALELGCYMQLTPLLERMRGYREVVGGYYGPLGERAWKTIELDRRPFSCRIDRFDAERDVFPYEDNSFELVLACELIEHMISDPMHLLLECRRVLEEGGRLLITTPNAASLTSVWRTLHGYDSPQIYSKYTVDARARGGEAPHVREYTAHELRAAVDAAGFDIELLTTEPIAKFAAHRKMAAFLEEHGFNPALRGEQTYCIGVKRGNLPVNRYPEFLYYR